MKFSKQAQYALLFTLRLTVIGRLTVEDAAKELKLSKSFLEQVARKLRLSGIVRSVRGPRGGYELVENPTVSQVLTAVQPINWLTAKEKKAYGIGLHEEHVLLNFVTNFTKHSDAMLNQTLRAVGNQFLIDDMNVGVTTHKHSMSMSN